MDIQAALYDLLDAIECNDREMTLEYLDALQGWISKGGFMPEVYRCKSIDGTFQVSRKPRSKDELSKPCIITE